MNKQKFIELLNKPGDLKEVNLDELDDLVAENPYFQAARVLEAKGHRLLKSKVAGRKTASAAIYSTNRILLKKYLAGDGKLEKPVAPQPTPYVEKQRPVARPAEKPAAQAPPSEPPTPAQTASVQSAPVPTPKDDSQGSSSIDQLIYNLHKDMEELEKSRARYLEVSQKIEEEEAVEKAVKKATKKSTEAGEAKKATPSKPAAKAGTATPAKTTKSTSKTKSTTATTVKAETEKKTTPAKKATATKTATKSSAAKSKTASKTTAKKTTAKSTPRKSSPKSTARKSTSRTSKSSKTTKTSKKEDNDGENQHQLINEFIKNNPSFKPAQESSEQKDLSVDSTALPDDIATEYLAEIFLGQGKKDKALKIYNSLMLRFPEKKAYFAGRIKKIK